MTLRKVYLKYNWVCPGIEDQLSVFRHKINCIIVGVEADVLVSCRYPKRER